MTCFFYLLYDSGFAPSALSLRLNYSNFNTSELSVSFWCYTQLKYPMFDVPTCPVTV